jgi:predicted extracellular nuclease
MWSGTDWASANLLFNGDDAVVLRKAGKDDAGGTPRPEELEIQLAKLALAIEVELELPEILVVQEVENTEILQVLGGRLNASAGTNYVATSYETRDGRGIEVGFLWDANRVELLDAYLLSGPEVDAAFGRPWPVWPAEENISLGRQPLVGLFEVAGSAGGKRLWVIGNHFRGKEYDDPIYGRTQPPDRDTEPLRKQQARVVRDYVNGILEDDPQAWVIVTGDLQDFQFPEPGEGADHPMAILEGGPGEVPLTNLVELEKEAERFTFVRDGNGQVLDHMLVSPALLDLVVGQDILHFNAGYPDVLRSDPSTPLRASDHDPVEGRFSLP